MTTVTTASDGVHTDHLRGRSLLKESDLTAAEFLSLVDLAVDLRAEKQSGT